MNLNFNPKSREGAFLGAIAGDYTGKLPTPLSAYECYLAAMSGNYDIAKLPKPTSELLYALRNVVLKLSGNEEPFEIEGTEFSFKNVKSVIIPDSYTSIGKAAFANSSNLEKITIPDSILSIEGSAFSQCTKLKEITIPKNVTSIGDRVFSGCTSLVNVLIPGNVSSLGIYCFGGCTSLKSVTIASLKITTIPSNLLYNCVGVEINVPSSVTTIASDAFKGDRLIINIAKPENSISGAPWGGTNATVNWLA